MRRIGLLVACLLLSACSDAAETSPRPPTTSSPTTPSATPDGPGPVVVAISVDGFTPVALEELGRAGAPNLWRLIDQGASTLNARTTYESTETLPNHTSMLTGRGVAGDDGTSVTFNDDNHETLADVHGSYVPSAFDVVHDHGLGTALYAEKDKFAFLLRSWRAKIDRSDIAASAFLYPQVDLALTEQGLSFVFWHIRAPDAAGHAHGWLSPDYFAAVREVDRLIGTLLNLLDESPLVKARTTILLTADHGGPRGRKTHNQATLLANERIPFLAWGRGVAEGADLYALNEARRDPGDGRPDYSGPQPVRNLDLADTALASLGLPATPGAPADGLEPLRLR